MAFICLHIIVPLIFPKRLWHRYSLNFIGGFLFSSPQSHIAYKMGIVNYNNEVGIKKAVALADCI